MLGLTPPTTGEQRLHIGCVEVQESAHVRSATVSVLEIIRSRGQPYGVHRVLSERLPSADEGDT